MIYLCIDVCLVSCLRINGISDLSGPIGERNKSFEVLLISRRKHESGDSNAKTRGAAEDSAIRQLGNN